MRVVIAAVVVAVAAAGCSAWSDDRGERESQRRGSAVVDEVAGTYRGVGMGAAEEDVRRALGEPGGGDGFFPLGTTFGEIGGAPAVRNWPHDWRGRPAILRYEDVAFLVGPRGVFAFVVTEDGARTKRGIGIGDELQRAQQVYGAGCGEQPYGESLFGGDTPSFRWCRATIADRVRIWFGRDPIRSITIARVGRG